MYISRYDKNGKIVNTLEIKYPVKEGDTWESDNPYYRTHNKNRVIAVNQKIETRLGTFNNAILIRTDNEEFGVAVYKHFVLGIGLVRERPPADRSDRLGNTHTELDTLN